MKTWQKGIPLEEINKIKSDFSEYNKRLVSPFSQFGGPKIADSLSKERLHYIQHGHDFAYTVAWFNTYIAKTSTDIKMFPDVVLGTKLKGDRIVDAFVNTGYDLQYGQEKLISALESFTEPTWVFINQEWDLQRHVVESAGYKHVGTKFNTFGELQGVYFKEGTSLFERELPTLDAAELACIAPLNVPNFTELCGSFMKKLEEFEDEFANHPSKKNKYDSWGAISIRGYSSDYTEIGKPNVGKGEWSSNAEGVLQDTELRKRFSEIELILKELPTPEVDRIRIMRLRPNGGIARHSDQIEKTAGVADGKLCRIHVPIQTEPEVLFHMWDHNGKEHVVNMPTGSTYLFDYRKPHAVSHSGKHDRIHIVIDLVSNEALRKLING